MASPQEDTSSMPETEVEQDSASSIPADTKRRIKFMELTAKDIEETIEFVKTDIYRERDSQEIVEATKEISILSKKYKTVFSKISGGIENWLHRRQRLVRDLQKTVVSTEKTRLITKACKIVFTTLGMAGTVAGLAFCRDQRVMSSKVLLAVDVMSCLSLFYSIGRLYESQVAVEEIVERYDQDNRKRAELKELFDRFSDFDNDVQNVFPHGIDANLSCALRSPISSVPTRREDMTLQLQALLTEKPCIQIGVLIVLCNLPDSKLDHDEDFLAKVRLFSESSFALKWWNRQMYKYFERTPMYAFTISQKLRKFDTVDDTSYSFIYLLLMMFKMTGTKPFEFFLLSGLFFIGAYVDRARCTRKLEVIETLKELTRKLQEETAGIVQVW